MLTNLILSLQEGWECDPVTTNIYKGINDWVDVGWVLLLWLCDQLRMPKVHKSGAVNVCHRDGEGNGTEAKAREQISYRKWFPPLSHDCQLDPQITRD